MSGSSEVQNVCALVEAKRKKICAGREMLRWGKTAGAVRVELCSEMSRALCPGRPVRASISRGYVWVRG